MSHWYLYGNAVPLSSAFSTYPTTAPSYSYATSTYHHPGYHHATSTAPTNADDRPLFDDYRVAGKRVPWDSDVPVSMDMYDDDNEAPDVIIIKNRGASFTLHFRAYAIGDGILTVGDVREAAAARLGVSSPRRVKLLYKGKLLKVDHVPAKQVGLKQNSQVLCVVGEEFGPEGSSSEVSVDEAVPVTRSHRRYSTRHGRSGGYDDRLDDPELLSADHPSRNSRRHRSPSSAHFHAPVHDGRSPSRPPARSPSRGPPPPPLPPHPAAAAETRRHAPAQIPPSANLNTAKSPMGKIEILEEYFDEVIEPLCLDYIEEPPVDQKTREFEHRRINETTMQQLMLKADAIDVEGDEYVRQRRKALIGKIEKLLKVVDEVAKQ